MRLSIIITIYKAERYIEQCIRSLYQHGLSIEDFEVIAVDNASPDQSIAIVQRLQLEFNNLRITSLTHNHCAGGGRNAGLKEAKGDYIWFVDSDDYVYPNVLETLLREVEDEELDFIHFDYDILKGNELQTLPETEPTRIMSGSDLLFKCGFPWQEHVVVWRKLFKRSFLLDNDLFFLEDIILDDDDFVFRSYAIARRTQHLNIKAYVYRVYENSTFQHRETIDYIKCLLVQISQFQRIIDQYSEKDLNHRFIPTVKQFLRYDINELFDSYHLIKGKEKKTARKMIRVKMTSDSLQEYSSRKRVLLFKLGLL